MKNLTLEDLRELKEKVTDKDLKYEIEWLILALLIKG